jgi:hypothetical protein
MLWEHDKKSGGTYLTTEDACIYTHEEIEVVIAEFRKFYDYYSPEDIARLNYQSKMKYDIGFACGTAFKNLFSSFEEFEKLFGHLPPSEQVSAVQKQYREKRKAEKALEAAKVYNGYVYLIKAATGLYKIGRTKSLNDRFSFFKNNLPFEVELIHTISAVNYKSAEKELHERFAPKRENGEWFRLTQEDVNLIEAITKM